MNSLCRFVIQSSPVVTLVALVCSTNAGKRTAGADASSRLALGVIRCGEGGRFQIEDQRRNGTYVNEKCIGPLPATWQLPMSDHNTAHSNTCSVEAGWGGRRRMAKGERSRVRIGRIGSGQGPNAHLLQRASDSLRSDRAFMLEAAKMNAYPWPVSFGSQQQQQQLQQRVERREKSVRGGRRPDSPALWHMAGQRCQLQQDATRDCSFESRSTFHW
jgi:hypothetical protein